MMLMAPPIPPIPPVLPPLPSSALAVKGNLSPVVAVILMATLVVYLISLVILLREIASDWKVSWHPSERCWLAVLLGLGGICVIFVLAALMAIGLHLFVGR